MTAAATTTTATAGQKEEEQAGQKVLEAILTRPASADIEILSLTCHFMAVQSSAKKINDKWQQAQLQSANR
jgi:hypothetical protein